MAAEDEDTRMVERLVDIELEATEYEDGSMTEVLVEASDVDGTVYEAGSATEVLVTTSEEEETAYADGVTGTVLAETTDIRAAAEATMIEVECIVMGE